ncbi:delta and Notch-like epidermal growth factor-related receptor [Meleagris gallopavo]|uniref:delta and Notch-like epidermal growth factor-related receptor n=1 Tax=Meleagris gallopavo TaxID=9103 RepID=UPI000549DCEF|nr:delta and Notch-like epidermal growth factor-related receptor [Meleagris gallopavo]
MAMRTPGSHGNPSKRFSNKLVTGTSLHAWCGQVGGRTISEPERSPFLPWVIDLHDGFFPQFISDPCASNPCHHGNCSTSGDGYLCACSDGYEGANCEHSRHSPPLPEQQEASSPPQSKPVTSTLEPDVILPHSRATVTLPTWQPRAGQKVVDLKWDEIEILPDVACGNASSNTSAGGRLVSFEVPQNTSIKIRQDATASLILLWKVTTAGFKQCSLIDGRSVTLLQALGGLVLSEEMLALGNNYFIGFLNDSVTKCIVALRLTVIVKVSTCMPAGSHSDKFQCSGKGKCITKPDEATFFCECEDEYWGPLCEEFDACQSQPCQNNATCTDLAQKHDGSNFTCSCLPGFPVIHPFVPFGMAKTDSECNLISLKAIMNKEVYLISVELNVYLFVVAVT